MGKYRKTLRKKDKKKKGRKEIKGRKRYEKKKEGKKKGRGEESCLVLCQRRGGEIRDTASARSIGEK